MPSTLRTALLSAALACAAVASSPAWAQTGEPHGQRPGAAQFQAMREAHERQHVQDLKTILRLRPDQEPALTAFLQSHKRPDRGEGPDRHGPPAEALTTPQRLDAMARREAEHAQAGQRHTEAVRTFYAALDPQQRQVFDALMRLEHGGHGHGGMRHGGWGHGEKGPGEGGHRGPEGPPPPRG